MFDTSALAKRTAFALKNACDLPEDKHQIVAYSLDLVYSGLLGFILAVAVGFIFGVPMLTFVAMLAGAMIRPFAGGGHCASPARCSTASISFVAIALLARFLGATVRVEVIAVMYIVLLVVAVPSFHLWAPAEAANKPITDRQQRARLRLWALIALVAVLLVGFLHSLLEFRIAILFGVALQVWSVMPIGHKSINAFDRFLLRIGIK